MPLSIRCCTRNIGASRKGESTDQFYGLEIETGNVPRMGIPLTLLSSGAMCRLRRI